MQDSEDIFEMGNIFVDREFVRIGHISGLDRVVGRDEGVRAVGGALGLATRWSTRNNDHLRENWHWQVTCCEVWDSQGGLIR